MEAKFAHLQYIQRKIGHYQEAVTELKRIYRRSKWNPTRPWVLKQMFENCFADIRRKRRDIAGQSKLKEAELRALNLNLDKRIRNEGLKFVDIRTRCREVRIEFDRCRSYSFLRKYKERKIIIKAFINDMQDIDKKYESMT